jgi:hypothetical protein
MQTITVKGGTPQEGESLCATCTWVHMQRGFRESEKSVFCTYNSVLREVKFKVAECTDYSDRTVPNRWDMEKIALLINVDPARKAAGFAGLGSGTEEELEPQLVSVEE